MGCWGSKSEDESKDSTGAPCVPPAGTQQTAAKFQSPAPIDGHIRLPWAAEATKWRWLLRTSQSLVAATLYGLGTWLRFPSAHVALQSLAAVVLDAGFIIAYHGLSMNNAGGYYDTFAEMFSRLPQHLEDIRRRGGYDYHVDIEQERRNGIVRTVNALESGIVFLAVSLASLSLAGICGLATGSTGSAFASGYTWRFFEWSSFLAIHRLIGANIFEGKHYGLLQPEAMWQFECVLADYTEAANGVTVDCRMRPLPRHPHPSY